MPLIRRSDRGGPQYEEGSLHKMLVTEVAEGLLTVKPKQLVEAQEVEFDLGGSASRDDEDRVPIARRREAKPS